MVLGKFDILLYHYEKTQDDVEHIEYSLFSSLDLSGIFPCKFSMFCAGSIIIDSTLITDKALVIFLYCTATSLEDL